TGITGRQTIKYLQNHPDRDTFTFSIAGRSEEKLKALVSELSLPDDVNVLIVDVKNDEQIEAAVKTAKVVLNTVGPFWLYGSPVVAACVRNGVHHVDVDGETHWIKWIITAFDHAATNTGAIIVPSCGLESLPSDIVAFLGHKTVNAPISKSTTAYDWMLAGFTGGSMATMLAEHQVVPPAFLKLSKDSYSLSPMVGVPPDPPKSLYTLQVPHTKEVIVGGRNLFAAIDTSLVHRSWGLLEYDSVHRDTDAARNARYGPQFQYEEFQPASSRAKALMLSLSHALNGAILPTVINSPLVHLLKALLPKPGDGPKDEDMHKGHIDLVNVTSSADGTIHAKTTFKAKGDGYFLSSVMLSECALALLHPETLPEMALRGGVLTPATACGEAIVKRLKLRGYSRWRVGY
ncbi:Saccharopine dehydrogenase-domain-containing protein, partial [Mucidula mucida]